MEKTAKILMVLAVMALIATTAVAEKQTVCPVGSGEIDKNLLRFYEFS